MNKQQLLELVRQRLQAEKELQKVAKKKDRARIDAWTRQLAKIEGQINDYLPKDLTEGQQQSLLGNLNAYANSYHTDDGFDSKTIAMEQQIDKFIPGFYTPRRAREAVSMSVKAKTVGTTTAALSGLTVDLTQASAAPVSVAPVMHDVDVPISADDLFNKGNMYYEGDGVPKDEATALEYFMKAAELGHVSAMDYIGAIYRYSEDIAKDYKIAYGWFCKAADMGNATSMLEVGNFYYDGEVVSQDYALALEWFCKAAEKGNKNAMNAAGFCYSNGIGVAKDVRSGIQWYQKAADRGNNISMRNLALIYEEGDGVEVDYEKARYWFTKAVENGNKKAQAGLEALAEKEAAFKKQKNAEAAQKQIKTAEPPKHDAPTAARTVPISSFATSQLATDPNDIKEFGEAEAEAIARLIDVLRTVWPDVQNIADRYRETLRNRGPLKGVNYTVPDTSFLASTPDSVTPRVEGISGKKQSITEDYIDLTVCAFSQYASLMEFTGEKSPYCVRFDYSSIVSQVRSTPQQYQAVCERLMRFVAGYDKLNGKDLLEQIAVTFDNIFYQPTEEDLVALKAAVVDKDKISAAVIPCVVLPGHGGDEITCTALYDKNDLLDFCNQVGTVEPGRKGGLFKSATNDRFLGVDERKLEAYKERLKATLPRLCQKAANQEYTLYFVLKKLRSDYLLVKSLPDCDASSICEMISNFGLLESVPDIFRAKHITSASEIEAALLVEGAKHAAKRAENFVAALDRGSASQNTTYQNKTCGDCRHIRPSHMSPSGCECRIQLFHANTPFSKACEKFSPK